MDFSKHVRSGITTYYAYYEYELLDDAQREANKGELQCYGCSAPTKFVKASKSGSQAYFGLMPGEVHEEGNCEELNKANEGASLRRKREEKYYIEAVEKIRNTTGEIEIDSTSTALFEKLAKKEDKSAKQKKSPSNNKQQGNKGKSHVISSEQVRASRKNLVQLLKFCLYSSRFLKGSGLKLHYKGRKYFSNERVKQFFQVANITNTKIPYFFYGSIRAVDDSLSFIHVGAQETQVVVDKSIRNQLWNALEVDKYWQLLNAQMICFGWVNLSKNGKNNIVIKDISDIAIIDIKENKNFKPHEDNDSGVALTVIDDDLTLNSEEVDDEIYVENTEAKTYLAEETSEIPKHINKPVINYTNVEISSHQAKANKTDAHQVTVKEKRSWISSLISLFRKDT